MKMHRFEWCQSTERNSFGHKPERRLRGLREAPHAGIVLGTNEMDFMGSFTMSPFRWTIKCKSIFEVNLTQMNMKSGKYYTSNPEWIDILSHTTPHLLLDTWSLEVICQNNDVIYITI